MCDSIFVICFLVWTYDWTVIFYSTEAPKHLPVRKKTQISKFKCFMFLIIMAQTGQLTLGPPLCSKQKRHFLVFCSLFQPIRRENSTHFFSIYCRAEGLVDPRQ